MKLLKIIFIIQLYLMTQTTLASEAILFIAHGSPEAMGDMSGDMSNMCMPHAPTVWEQYVLDEIKKVQPYINKPIEVAFGMWETACFDAGIENLKGTLAKNNETLTDLHVMPFFITSFNEVIRMQEYIFGLRSEREIPIPSTYLSSFTGKVHYHNADKSSALPSTP